MIWGRKEKKEKTRMGISGKMILNIAIPTAVILVILAVIVTATVVNTVFSLKNEDMTNQMQAVSDQVTEYFDPFFVNAEFVMDRASIQQLFDEMDQGPSTYRFESSETYQQAMHDLQYANTVGGETVKNVWIAGVKNSQVMQSDGYLSDPSVDITEKIWYTMLMENDGENTVSAAYTDDSSGEIVVAVTTAYRNDSGDIIGVVGLDISLNTLIEHFSQISIGESGYITVYDSEDTLLYHPNSDLLMYNQKDMEYSENMQALLKSQQNSEVVAYQDHGATYYGGTLYIDDFGWSILAGMPKSEYMRETTVIFSMLIIGFLLCIVITSFYHTD